MIQNEKKISPQYGIVENITINHTVNIRLRSADVTVGKKCGKHTTMERKNASADIG